jgi:hypothetical protein
MLETTDSTETISLPTLLHTRDFLKDSPSKQAKKDFIHKVDGGDRSHVWHEPATDDVLHGVKPFRMY